MADFARGDELDLEYGVRLRAVQVDGAVGEVSRPSRSGGPVRSADPGFALPVPGLSAESSAAFVAATAEAGMQTALSIPLTDLQTPRRDRGGTRGAVDGPRVELEVPAPPEGEGQVLLEVDDTGLVRWHVAAGAAGRTGGVRGQAGQVFRVPVTEWELDGGPATDRGVLGWGLRKVLRVVRYPVETVAGRAAGLGVGSWERRRRPYRLDLVTAPANGAASGSPGIDATDLATSADGTFLLLVHGTFSQARSAFHDLFADSALMAELDQRYGGRVLVFDHPSLHVDPDANVAWLLDRLPDRVPLTFDVVCHSRGGLVARRLSDPALAAAAGRPAPVVRNLVHVAAPNAGTLLASPDRWDTLIDVLTNVFLLAPDGPVEVTLEGVLELVKQIGTGVLAGLPGLAAMDPEGPYLATPDAAPAHSAFGVASSFAPSTSSPLPLRVLDKLAAPFFPGGNDLVVPTDGVFESPAGYRVADREIVKDRSIIHTAFFGSGDVRRRVASWLPG